MRRNALELNPRVKLLLVGFTAALWVHSAAPTQAHGAKIEALPQTVEIIATFDTGEPMANAQVSVYAPSTPNTPWQTGQTDSEGRFAFTPDTSVADGLWEVTVRKAGHGQTTSFPLEVLNSTTPTSSTLSPQSATQKWLQKWLSMVAIIWGFIGTALYFSNRDSKGKSHPKSATGPAVDPDLESAQAAGYRATVTARLGDEGKATAEEYR